MEDEKSIKLLTQIRDAIRKQSDGDVIPLADLLTILFLVPSLLIAGLALAAGSGSISGVTHDNVVRWIIATCATWIIFITILLSYRVGSFNSLTTGKLSKSFSQSQRGWVRVVLLLILLATLAICYFI